MYRTEDHVPEWYISESRDFQLISRIHDAGYNSFLSDAHFLRYLTSTNNMMSNMLELLQTKLGFFTNKSIDNDSLRIILSAFPWAVKNKGSARGIKQMVYCWLNVMHIKAESIVEVDGKTSTVIVKLNTKSVDTSLLTELLRFVMPTGFFVRYEFYIKSNPDATKTVVSQNIYNRGIDNFDKVTGSGHPDWADNSNSSLQDVNDAPTGINNDDVNAIDTIELWDSEENE